MEQFLPYRGTSYSHIYPCPLRLLSLGTYATAMGCRAPRITFWALAVRGRQQAVQAASGAGRGWQQLCCHQQWEELCLCQRSPTQLHTLHAWGQLCTRAKVSFPLCTVLSSHLKSNPPTLASSCHLFAPSLSPAELFIQQNLSPHEAIFISLGRAQQKVPTQRSEFWWGHFKQG